jgi:hypothetical protein
MPGLSLDLDLARRLAERLIPVRVCVGEIVERFDLALGSDAADDLTTGRHLALRLSGAIDTLIRVRGRDHAVGERLCLAEKLVRDLESLLARRQVDASGADLSDTVIKHLDAVDGTIWTAQTIWPPAIADQVRAGSLETQPGVYQVQLGSQPDHSAAAQA